MNKTLIRIILLIIFASNNNQLFGQNVTHVREPIFFEDESIEDFKIRRKVLDEIRYKGQLVHTEIEFKNDTLEYFKVNDSIYFFRQISSEHLCNEGYFKLSNQINRVDSISTIDPETYDEKLMVISYVRTKKHGDWNETLEDSTYWQGSYKDGKKTGRWFRSIDKIDFYKYGEYQNGELKILYKPTVNDFNENIRWIVNKPFTLCIIGYKIGNSSEIETWCLETEKNEYCQSFGEFVFKEDKSFVYKHNSLYEMEIKKYDGNGTWKVNCAGNFVLRFENGEEETFSIEELGHDKISMRRLKR